MREFQRMCLVHYHEIGLKGHNRSTFEMRLLRNLEAHVADFPVVTIFRISGRLCVFIKEGTDYDTACRIADVISRVPGVARVSCGYVCDRDLDEMYVAAERAVNDAGAFETFKVKARRNHTDFPVDSMEMNQLVGAYLCEKFPDKKVQMKGQDLTVCVEVVQGSVYVYAHSLRGIGGLPVGSAGKVVCLLSSGSVAGCAAWGGVHRRSLFRPSPNLGNERIPCRRDCARARADWMHGTCVRGAVRRRPTPDCGNGSAVVARNLLSKAHVPRRRGACPQGRG